MQHTLYRALNINKEEAPLVFRLLLLQFCLGLATAFLVTASYSFLLYKYNIQEVPLVYVVVALILFPVNGLYVRLDLRMSARKLLELVIGLAIVSIPLLIAAWKATKAPWLPMVIVGWNVTLYMLVGYAYWGMASLLFNVRESRRIFSVIGSGDLPAKILGYWAISTFSPLVGIESTMLFSLVFYALALLVTRIHFGNGKIDWEQYESHQHHTVHHRHEQWWMRIFESPLILYISGLSMLAYGVMHLSEFTFLSEIKGRFDSSSDILRFVSAFFAVGRMLALVFKLLFSSRLIASLGLTRSLLFTPLLILAMAATILMLTLTGSSSTLHLYAFGIMFMVSELLRSVIQEPAFFILFQPLNIHLRLKGHVVAKGYVYPPILLLTGAGLWWWMHTHSAVSFLLVLSLTIACVVAWMAIIPLISRAYQQAVEQSIQKGFFTGVALFLNSDKVVPGREEEKIHALHLLQQSGYGGLEKLAVALLPGAEKDFRAQLLQLVATRRFPSAIPVLERMSAIETDPAMQALLFRTRCFTDDAFLQAASPRFTALTAAEQRSVLEALHHRGSSLTPALLDHLQVAALKDEASLEHLLEVMSLAPADWQLHTLAGLYDYPLSTSARRKLLVTTGRLGNTHFLPQMLQALLNPALASAAREGLTALGDPAIEAFASAESGTGEEAMSQYIEVAQHIRSVQARNYLISLLQPKAPWHEKVIHALWKQGLAPTGEQQALLDAEARRLLQQASDKMELLKRQTPTGNAQPSLLHAIRNEVESNTLSALKLMALTQGHDYVERIADLLRIRQYHKLHNAIELMDLTLPKVYFQQLQALLEFVARPLHRSAAATRLPLDRNDEACITYIVENPNVFGAWTRSLAWYLAGRMGHRPLLQRIAAQPASPRTRIESETLQFVHLSLDKH
ncbi:MAG: hypothetical protein MUF29_08885 [Chitinophagaceae bacterium]|nr:hypothetical protein [Chitinophagaceae bacterium]